MTRGERRRVYVQCVVKAFNQVQFAEWELSDVEFLRPYISAMHQADIISQVLPTGWKFKNSVIDWICRNRPTN